MLKALEGLLNISDRAHKAVAWYRNNHPEWVDEMEELSRVIDEQANIMLDDMEIGSYDMNVESKIESIDKQTLEMIKEWQKR